MKAATTRHIDPLCIEVLTRMLEFNVKELRKPTNFACLMEQKIEAELEKEAKKRDEETHKGNGAYKGEQEYDIRKRSRDELHKAIDDQLERWEHSLKYAVKVIDTSMQWDLVAAAVEAARIKVFELG